MMNCNDQLRWLAFCTVLMIGIVALVLCATGCRYNTTFVDVRLDAVARAQYSTDVGTVAATVTVDNDAGKQVEVAKEAAKGASVTGIPGL